MKIYSWVDFHLSNTQAWVRNSTPPQVCVTAWDRIWDKLGPMITALNLGLRPDNEGRRYKETPSLIGWAQT